MKFVGRSFRTIGKRLLIIQSDPGQLPRLYSEVVTEESRPLGKIVDIFGNIETPYAAVVCYGECSVHPGENLYTRYEGRWDARDRKGKITAVRTRSAQKAGSSGQGSRKKK